MPTDEVQPVMYSQKVPPQLNTAFGLVVQDPPSPHSASVVHDCRHSAGSPDPASLAM